MLKTTPTALALAGALFASAAFGLTGPVYTGELLPKPREVLGAWQNLPLAPRQLDIQTEAASPRAVVLGRDLLAKRISELAGQAAMNTPPPGRVTIVLGRLQDDLVKKADARFSLKLAGLALKPEGYVIRVRQEPGETHIIAAGVDSRGAFYAAATLLQQTGLVDGKLILRLADLNDWPDWPRRYVSDYNPSGAAAMEFLALNKINGFAFQHRFEWHDFNADTPQNWGRISTYGAVLKEMKAFRDQTGLLDYMLVLNIYADRKQPWFDITNEADLQNLITRCQYAADNGITHIMICVDDWTPNENGRYVCPHPTERKQFNDSVGKAQGYLMTSLFNALHQTYPEVELSVAPPVYSLLDHKAAEPAGAEYLRDLSASLPPEVFIVWTGPRVISDRVEKTDFTAFSKLVNHHRLTFWDNSECINTPLPHWVTRFYDGFAADSGGLIFLNMHAFGWPWCVPFDLNANDYLWNPKGYDPVYSYRNAVEKVYGTGTYPAVAAFISKLEALQKTTDKAAKLALIQQLEQLLKEFEKLNLPTQHPTGPVTAAKAELSATNSTLKIPRLAVPPAIDGDLSDPAWAQAATFDFKAPMNSTQELQPAQGKIGFDDQTLYLGLVMHHQKPLAAPVFKDRHDDAVYNSPDAVEIFLQDAAAGFYAHFALDHMGNYFDEKDGGGAGSWNPPWRVMVKKGDHQWTAEIAIPLTAIAPDAAVAGRSWKGNFCRVYNAEGQASTWSPVFGSFHNPVFWGTLTFAN